MTPQKVKQAIQVAATQKMRNSIDGLTIHDMYIWLEGFLAGKNIDTTANFLIGSRILQELFTDRNK